MNDGEGGTIEDDVWQKLMALVPQAEPRSVRFWIHNEHDDVMEMLFTARSHFDHRPGQGFLAYVMNRQFMQHPMYPLFLERSLRHDVSVKCPYARQFLEEPVNGSV